MNNDKNRPAKGCNTDASLHSVKHPASHMSKMKLTLETYGNKLALFLAKIEFDNMSKKSCAYVSISTGKFSSRQILRKMQYVGAVCRWQIPF